MTLIGPRLRPRPVSGGHTESAASQFANRDHRPTRRPLDFQEHTRSKAQGRNPSHNNRRSFLAKARHSVESLR